MLEPRPQLPDPRATHAPPHRFTFAGVACEVLAGEGVVWQLPRAYEPFVAPFATKVPEEAASRAPLLAEVLCSLALDPSLAGHEAGLVGNRPRFALHERGVSVEAQHLRLTLTLSAPRRYLASARVSAHPDALGSLLLALAFGAAQLGEAVSLHATAIELDGRAVLFTGPSGTGKTTAAELTPGARLLSADRVTLSLLGGRAWAFALPTGRAARLPPSQPLALPVAALLRIRRARPAPALIPAQGIDALFLLREAMEIGVGLEAFEAARLERLAPLAASLRVGTLHTVLGQPLDGLIRAFTSGAAASEPIPQASWAGGS